MEDHHHHHQYGMSDLRHFISSSRPNLYAPQAPNSLLSSHPYDMLLFGSSSSDHNHNIPTTNNATISVSSGGGEIIYGGGGGGGGDGNSTGRWPRQETLTLLEIRSMLDPKFKEANQKGPLWDDVSRIMSDEHGYQRSGKKCREKFENLYKYYKKTKEGKAGRQDGKHYRFFRQLEALYGETNSNNSAETHLINNNGGNFNFPIINNIPLPNNNNQESLKLSDQDTSLNLSNLSDSYTSSSDDDSDFIHEGIMKKRSKKNWKIKIKDFIDAKMRVLMDKQEAWMEKMTKSIENKEQERLLREEEWRKQDAARIEREHKFWANERAWIEARDCELMDALQKLTGKNLRASRGAPEELVMGSTDIRDDLNNNEPTMNINSLKIWQEGEVTRLIQLRNGMELKFQQCGGVSEEVVLWEEIASKLGCYGHERSGLMCKEKWDSSVNYDYVHNKKRKENCNTLMYYDQNNHEVFSNQLGGRSSGYCEQGVVNHSSSTMRLNDNGNSPPESNTSNAMNDGNCFRYFMGDAYGRIMD